MFCTSAWLSDTRLIFAAQAEQCMSLMLIVQTVMALSRQFANWFLIAARRWFEYSGQAFAERKTVGLRPLEPLQQGYKSVKRQKGSSWR
jgi:hypothetical protein